MDRTASRASARLSAVDPALTARRIAKATLASQYSGTMRSILRPRKGRTAPGRPNRSAEATTMTTPETTKNTSTPKAPHSTLGSETGTSP